MSSTSHAPRETLSLRSGSTVNIWTANDPQAIVILQHGFGEYAERYVTQYHQLIPRLGKSGYDVWALDMQDHGRSPGLRSVTDVGQAVQDHVEMRRLAEEKSLPIFLFGHPPGGLVTASSASTDPSSIQGVILTGPAIPAPMLAPVCWVLRMLARLIPTAEVPLQRRPTSGLSSLPEQVELVRKDPHMLKGGISFLLAATAVRTAMSLWRSLGKWHIPTLVIHGSKDTFTDPDYSKRFVDGIAASDKTLHLIENGRHEPLNDIQRDAVISLIFHWLSEHLRGNQAGEACVQLPPKPQKPMSGPQM